MKRKGSGVKLCPPSGWNSASVKRCPNHSGNHVLTYGCYRCKSGVYRRRVLQWGSRLKLRFIDIGYDKNLAWLVLPQLINRRLNLLGDKKMTFGYHLQSNACHNLPVSRGRSITYWLLISFCRFPLGLLHVLVFFYHRFLGTHITSICILKVLTMNMFEACFRDSHQLFKGREGPILPVIGLLVTSSNRSTASRNCNLTLVLPSFPSLRPTNLALDSRVEHLSLTTIIKGHNSTSVSSSVFFDFFALQQPHLQISMSSWALLCANCNHVPSARLDLPEA